MKDGLYNQLTTLNFKNVVNILKNQKREIINSFVIINSRIKILLKTALKYKNFKRSKNQKICTKSDNN